MSEEKTADGPVLVVVKVAVSEAEYRTLRRMAAVLPSGTVAGALRYRAGLNDDPLGRNRERVAETDYLADPKRKEP